MVIYVIDYANVFMHVWQILRVCKMCDNIHIGVADYANVFMPAWQMQYV